MIAESIMQFKDVLALAYRLTPLEKIKLVKRMADALEHEPVLVRSYALGDFTFREAVSFPEGCTQATA